MLHEVCQRIDDERQRRSKFVGEVGEHSHPFFMPFVDFFLFHLLETDFPFSFLFVLLVSNESDGQKEKQCYVRQISPPCPVEGRFDDDV